MKTNINYDNDNLWCCYSKEKIEIGEYYVVIFDSYLGDEIKKYYKLEYVRFLDDEE